MAAMMVVISAAASTPAYVTTPRALASGLPGSYTSRGACPRLDADHAAGRIRLAQRQQAGKGRTV
jgi:hypothetical protein